MVLDQSRTTLHVRVIWSSAASLRWRHAAAAGDDWSSIMERTIPAIPVTKWGKGVFSCSLAFVDLKRLGMNRWGHVSVVLLPPVGLVAGSRSLSSSAMCSCIGGSSAIASGAGGNALSRRLFLALFGW